MGSAYKGKSDSSSGSKVKLGKIEAATSDSVKDELMQMAIAQRMNTDLRKSVFCVVMGAQVGSFFEFLYAQARALNTTYHS